MSDLRQRFYIEDCPVRGEVVHLEETLYKPFLAQRDYHASQFKCCWVKCSAPPHC